MFHLKIAETCYKEIKRKLIHFTSLLIIPVYFLFSKDFILFGGALLLVLFFLVEPIRLRVGFLNSVAREKEKDNIAAHIQSLTGFLVAIYFLPLSIASYGITISAFGDAMSALVGRVFGKYRIPWNRSKTFEGILGGLISSLLLSLSLSYLIFNFNIYLVLISPIVIILPDLIDLKLDDNLILPILVSTVAFVLANL